MPEVVPQSETKNSPPPAVPRKGPRGEVTIYPTWCKGCHICVEFCPQQVLAMDASNEHATVVHPEKCTACHFCDTHCPDLAIVVRKLE
ncbi:MAG: 4Fe-4S binding protein [Anaerolineales bacterium]|nr:4Fe-4S binding protein [Anaerolineales bacterium]